jgi:DNA-binding Xre family transcriptional regulator
MLKWRLRQYLDDHDLSAYRLVQEVEASPTTLYALARGTHERISLEVLDKVITGLERLTGEPVEVGDILERVPDPVPEDDQDALLASGTAGLGEALDDLECELPPGEVEAWLATFEAPAERG